MNTATRPVVVLGEFDGLHLGHRELIEQARQTAEQHGLPLVGVVFDVESRARVLSELADRTQALLSAGASSCRVIDVAASGVSAEQLAASIVAATDPQTLLMAAPPTMIDDDRYPDLIACFRRHDVAVRDVDRAEDDGGVITSGRLRAAVEAGDVATAAGLIGAPYTISGIVRQGRQLGRTIGFPTANLAPPIHRVLPRNGVYAADVRVDETTHRAAVNIGVRPTVESRGSVLIEAHLLDVDLDLYGRSISVAFTHHLRDERQFDGLDALQAQLADDVTAVRALSGPAGDRGSTG